MAKLAEAFEAGDDWELTEKLNDEVDYWDEQIILAAFYFRDIDDELAKKDDSALRIDKAATENSGEEHISLNSLDLWAKNKYRISILDLPRAYQTHSNLAESLDTNSETGEDETLSTTKAVHIFTTLAIAVEELAKLKRNLAKPDERPNVSALARYLSMRATEANNGNDFEGQSKHVLEKRITEALRIKNNKLK